MNWKHCLEKGDSCPSDNVSDRFMIFFSLWAQKICIHQTKPLISRRRILAYEMTGTHKKKYVRGADTRGKKIQNWWVFENHEPSAVHISTLIDLSLSMFTHDSRSIVPLN